MPKSYEYLSGKELTRQYWVREEDLWNETPVVNQLKVLSTRALISFFYSTLYELIKREIGADVVAADVHTEIKHFAVTPEKVKVSINIKVDYVKENHLFITGKAYDEKEQIGSASFERVITSFDAIKRRSLKKSPETAE